MFTSEISDSSIKKVVQSHVSFLSYSILTSLSPSSPQIILRQVNHPDFTQTAWFGFLLANYWPLNLANFLFYFYLEIVFHAIISPPLHWHWQWWGIYERDFWWNPVGRRIDEDGDPSFWRRIAHSWQLVTNSSKPSGCRNLWQIQIQRFPGLQIRVTNTNTCHPHVLPQYPHIITIVCKSRDVGSINKYKNCLIKNTNTKTQ